MVTGPHSKGTIQPHKPKDTDPWPSHKSFIREFFKTKSLSKILNMRHQKQTTRCKAVPTQFFTN